MPTLATSQEETEKTTVNVKNDSTESKTISRNRSRWIWGRV